MPNDKSLLRNIQKLQKFNASMREMIARKKELKEELKDLNEMIDQAFGKISESISKADQEELDFE